MSDNKKLKTYQVRKKAEPQLVNIDTGEVISKDSSNEELSVALKAVWEHIKALEPVRKGIIKLMQKKVRKDDQKFAEYWSIVRPNIFDIKLFKKEADKKIIKRLRENEVALNKIVHELEKQRRPIDKEMRKIQKPYIKKSTDKKQFSFRFPKFS